MTLAEISRESGLRQDLVSRFVPGMDTPSGKLYSAHHVALARYVKELTDLNVPSAAVQVTVHDMESRPEAEFDMILSQSRRQRGTMWGRLWAGIGAAAAAALLIGGLAGGLIGYNNGQQGSSTSAAPATVTAPAQPAQITPTIPTTPDPVCAEWAPLLDSYNAKLDAWTKSDPSIPADQWSPDQRALNMSAMQVMKSEAADMRRLADRAKDPFLAGLMNAQAMYEEAYAAQIPNYQPIYHRYWDAVVAFSGAVKGVCTAVAPR